MMKLVRFVNDLLRGLLVAVISTALSYAIVSILVGLVGLVR